MENECDCDVCREEKNNEQIYPPNRRILLTGEINNYKADLINNKLQFYSTSESPVYIYINSEGGDLNAGYAIIDQMELCPFPLFTIIRGLAASMGATIAAYGTKGCRFITKNSSVFIHNMSVELPANNINAQKIGIEHLIKYSEHKINDFMSRLKINRKKFEKLLNETCWMTAEEAIKIGLMDGIWTRSMENSVNINSLKE